MVNLGSNILILFALCAGLSLLFPLWKDGVIKQLSFKSFPKDLGPLLCILIPMAALFALPTALGSSVGTALACFAGAALLFLLLSRIGLPVQLRCVVLMIASVLLVVLMPAAEGVNLSLAAALMGLLVAKIADSEFLQGERELDDIAGPMAWLGGVLWLTTTDQSSINAEAGLLLGTISVCMALRIIQRPFMTDDRWLLKRLVLSASGGLLVLLVVTKLLLAPKLAPIALLVGAGMFASYLFKNISVADEKQDALGTSGIKLLIVIGMLTLVATRFFGMYGMVVLAPTVLLIPKFSFGQYVGLFFAARILLQVFVNAYNTNLTGINLQHAYTGAAQYAGFIVIGALVLLMSDIKNRGVITALLLIAGAIVPIVSNYYLHAEPTSSLLVASTVAAVIFAVLAPALQPAASKDRHELLLVLPALMSTSAIIFNSLIEAGNNAAADFKTTILAGGLAAVIILFVLAWLKYKRSNKTVATASE